MMSITTTESSGHRAAMYARVSSDQQAQQGTINSQLADLRQRIAADGLAVEEDLCFIDDGYVGSTLVRPALDRLRDVAHAGGFDRLYVHSPDRLARKYAWQVVLVEELQRSGVELIFLNRTIGVSPEEDLLLQMQGMIAEYERTKIMERCRRGKRHAARRGSINVLAGAPYGYRYIGKHEGGGQAHYQVKLEEARVVQQVFEWVARDRLSIRQAAHRLAAQGVFSAKGKRWCSETIGKMLKNPAYKGQAVFGKTRVGERRQPLRPGRGRPEHPRTPVSRYHGAPEDQIAIPVPAIVSEEMFDAVAEQLAENRKRLRQQTNASYLLQGLIECGGCGYGWYGHGLTRFRRKQKALYPYYRCPGRDAFRFGGQPICASKPLRLDRLDAAVWADVCAVIQNPDDLRREFERRLNGDEPSEVNLPQIDKQIGAVRRSISRLIDAYEDGLLDKEEFEPRLRQAKQRLDRLQQDAAAATDRTAQQAELRLVLGHLDQFAKQVHEGLDHADHETRRQIIRALVKVVKIEQDHVRIIYRISPRPFVDGRSGGPIPQHCPRRVERGVGRLARPGCPKPGGDNLVHHLLGGHGLLRLGENLFCGGDQAELLVLGRRVLRLLRPLVLGTLAHRRFAGGHALGAGLAFFTQPGVLLVGLVLGEQLLAFSGRELLLHGLALGGLVAVVLRRRADLVPQLLRRFDPHLAVGLGVGGGPSAVLVLGVDADGHDLVRDLRGVELSDLYLVFLDDAFPFGRAIENDLGDVAEVRSSVLLERLPEATIRRHLAEGAPRQAGRSGSGDRLNLVHYAAWLNKEPTDNDG